MTDYRNTLPDMRQLYLGMDGDFLEVTVYTSWKHFNAVTTPKISRVTATCQYWPNCELQNTTEFDYLRKENNRALDFIAQFAKRTNRIECLVSLGAIPEQIHIDIQEKLKNVKIGEVFARDFRLRCNNL